MIRLLAVLSFTMLACSPPPATCDACSAGGSAAGGSTSAGGAASGGGTATAGGTSGGGSSAGGSATAGGSSGGASAGGSAASTLSAMYPRDEGIAADPRVLFASGFENGMTGWTRFTQDPARLSVVMNAAQANAGMNFLQERVTRTQLAANQYISTNAQLDLSRRVPELYWRFYARVVGATAKPHHWVRVAAGTAGFQSDGLANTRPAGDQGFWFDVDLTGADTFNFYTYWHAMRSGRCNDGSATPGCAGDQGTTYYYGNNFTFANQVPIVRDRWFCLEVRAKANTVGSSDGELSLWKDGALVADYRPGTPRGRWLRDNFYSWGQYFQDVQAFEGFDFRTSADVLLKRVTLDAYYERGTLPAAAPEEQIIHYDDVVVATSRIGCRVP